MCHGTGRCVRETAMGTEIELKLTASPRMLQEAARLPWLRKLARSPVSRRKIVSVYFDTPKFKLRQRGVSLRIRRLGDKRLQTIKSVNGAITRGEWEEEICAERPDLKRAKGTALAPLATRKLKKSLLPVFETDVRRISVPLRFRGSDIEIALDRGQIKTGTRRAQVSEIELELKRGRRADLARLAARISRTIPVAYGARVKSERGYALRAGAEHGPVGAGPIALDPAATTAEAFAAIGSSCLDHFAANDPAVRRGDAEGLHQMRVGLRRLRAAISVFRDMLPDRDTARIKSELRWLTERLGPARDLDVLVTESVAPLRRASPDKSEVRLLEADLKQKRGRGFDRARDAIRSERYRKLVLATALWLIDGRWLTDKNALAAARRERPATEFARDVLQHRTRKVVKKSRRLDRLDARARHKLRIAAKKLRYAGEFFACLFEAPKKAHKRFARALKALQSALGKLNDIAVHQTLARRYAHPGPGAKKRSQKAFAIGVLAGREQKSERACLASARAAARQLAGTRPYWD
jgi:inorganic triphosphatase YgiF